MNQPYEYRWAQWGLFHNGSGASPVDYYRWVLSTYGDLENAWNQIRQTDLEKLGFRADKITRLMHIKAEMDRVPLPQAIHDPQLNVYSIDDPEYPEPLKTISNPPVFLWVKGKLPLFHKTIGIVGSRLITESGQLITEQITTNLVQRGWVIVSGLAMGVDACAHQTTLKHKGTTLAVLGCGLDRVYPAENRRLATEIIQSGGALISEFPIGSPALKHHFPMRNRIIAGLSKGIIITQANRKSGALITARYALDQGRDVFAVPTSPLHTKNSGTNHLIRRGEATLIESATDVLTEWKMDTMAKSVGPIEYTSLEATLIKALSKEPRTVDELVIDAGLNVARVSEALITLQLKQTVRQINLKWTLV